MGDTSTSDPATRRAGAIMAHGTMTAQTSRNLLEQWHPKYFSQIMPFVMPYMVSGPDFSFYQKELRWRRQSFGDKPDAPWVSPMQFVRGCARRVESQCRHDWSALPIIRTVTFKYLVETGGTLLAAPFRGTLGQTLNTHAKELIQAAQKLSNTLWNGFVRYGNIKVPINGDTTRLPQADGLTKKEKALARAISYKAQHFPGTQQVRQVMGHCHWGARIKYGDPLFFTISPNEMHSAWVLKLSRYGKNDPCVKYGGMQWQRMCGADYPNVAAKRRHIDPNVCGTCETLPDHTLDDHEIVVDLPEYDFRRMATAKDPLAVVEAHRLNISLRLAWLLGCRMCPKCPRCNAGRWGCQDLFGSNMRPTGGVIGGVSAFAVGNEHQQQGTPHGHGQAHVVCIYQYSTLREIAEEIESAWTKYKDDTLVQSMKEYNNWFHVERPLDPETYKEYKDVAEQHFFSGFADRQHAPLSQTPAFLQNDADCKEKSTWTELCSQPELLQEREAEGHHFVQQYLRDAQFVFSRVQHHVHRRDKDGNYVPLHACQRKVRKKRKEAANPWHCKCKADFPKNNTIQPNTILICQGMAKRFRLRVSGRRNAFGMWLGPRHEAWQSGTAPALAVHFRSNSHTMPNYRLPPIAAVHEATCPSKACKEHAAKMMEGLTIKKVSRLAQRVQREATGYYCGYTFKGQTIGRRLVLLASKSFNFMESELEEKSAHQQWRRMVNRVFTDIFHRCTSRPAAEEYNLAAFHDEQDVTNAEYIRTYMSVNFPGGQLIRKSEHEMTRPSTRSVLKLLAAPRQQGKESEADVILKYFPELYGFRGNLPAYKDVYYLSPWEFLEWWDVKRLPKPNVTGQGTGTGVPPLTIFAETAAGQDAASYVVNPAAERYCRGPKKKGEHFILLRTCCGPIVLKNMRCRITTTRLRFYSQGVAVMLTRYGCQPARTITLHHHGCTT